MITDAFHRFLKNLAHFQVRHPYITLALLLSLTIIMLAGAKLMQTNTSLEQMMPPQTQEIAAFTDLRDAGLGQDAIAVVLELDTKHTTPNQVYGLQEYRVYEYQVALLRVLEENHDVLAVRGVPTILGQTLTQEQYAAAINNPEMQSRLSGFMNADASRAAFLVLTDVSANDERMSSLATEIRADVTALSPPPGVTISLTGTPIIQQRLGELVQQDRSNTQWLATLLVFLITAAIFTSFLSALVPIIIVIISVNWLYGTMGFVGLPISTLAGGVAAMVIGIGIDFAIHILNKFKYERKKGFTIAQSIECAVVETGTALVATSLTTIAAFLAFLIGAMPEMNRFGLLMAMGIVYALTFSLFGLPALLVIEENIIYWSKKHLRFGIEKELHLEGGKKHA